ncbi:hypothetical protein PISMIDRAFT_19843 [Pisolithus microcarpus 441]|uniref:Uncharacterized protein n=1 Tax=Pisolithus microcarpus 441 TaxID=765257 RepID=A0A0C9YAR9_9AGAM|nr:hypothetical protein BKA83DRAFT_19843 [Pisolithus microcarpus]KIK11064.1 hypothetical protein PISMIDRAFT_19843 [Pisolithus microcarpus 441]
MSSVCILALPLSSNLSRFNFDSSSSTSWLDGFIGSLLESFGWPSFVLTRFESQCMLLVAPSIWHFLPSILTPPALF